MYNRAHRFLVANYYVLLNKHDCKRSQTKCACIKGDEEVPSWKKKHLGINVLLIFILVVIIENFGGGIYDGATRTKESY